MPEGASARSPIGPGRLVLVVGPSGAGKDTLIRAARERLASDPRYVFPRRWITRPPAAAEDNLEIAADSFEALRQAGAFAASWTAHGQGYGIPLEVDGDIAQGRTVVCNVSRTAVAELRRRYARTCVIEITAPRAVLEARLAGRGRREDGDLSERIARSDAVAPVATDLVITNDELETAAERFLAALRSEDGTGAAGEAARPEPSEA